MASHWFVDNTRARVTWTSAVSGGKAATDIYELVQRTDRAEVALMRYPWARQGDSVTAGQVTAAQAVEAAGTPPSGAFVDAKVHPDDARFLRAGRAATITAAWNFTTAPTVDGKPISAGKLVDNGDGTATWTA